ncbi:MAG TPA: endonuclease domain-containing protein, partial [Alphaproteobacteria bacterium]|nr:endonuclease domain-containing protein [Alphaproteobacteria bacterium]
LLRDRRFAGFKFRRQVPIGPYIADFCCFDAKLIIEIDGGQHAHESRAAKDSERTLCFQRDGFRVLRFWNNEILTNAEGALTQIAVALGIDWAQESPHPLPTPERSLGFAQAGGPLPQGERGR